MGVYEMFDADEDKQFLTELKKSSGRIRSFHGNGRNRSPDRPVLIGDFEKIDGRIRRLVSFRGHGPLPLE